MAMLIRNIYTSKQCSISIANIIVFSARDVSSRDVKEQTLVYKWLWNLKEKKHFNSFIFTFSRFSIFQMVTSQDKNLSINGCET